MSDRRPTRQPSRLRGRMLRWMAVVDRRTMALGVLVAVAGAMIGVLAALSANGVPLQKTYDFKVEVPGAAPPLRAGAQVRVAGKIAGIVKKVRPHAASMSLEAELKPQYAPLGRGARAHVGVLLGTSLAYVVLRPGDARHPLAEGTTIPYRRVTYSSSLPQAIEAFDATTRRALGRNFRVLGAGYLHRGAEVNAAIADLRAVFEDGVPLIDAMTPRPGVLGGAVADLAGVTDAARGLRADDTAAGTTSARRVFDQLAARRGTLGETVERFSDLQDEMFATLPLADRTLAATTAMVRAFEPGTKAVAQRLPAFVSLFDSGANLENATRRFNPLARPALRRLEKVLVALRDPAAGLGPIVAYAGRFGDLLAEYAPEMEAFGKGLVGVFGYRYFGQPAFRASGSLGCARYRNAYPKPGQVSKDRHVC